MQRKSDERYRRVFSLSSDFYWESDGQHRVTKIEHGPQSDPAMNRSQIGKTRWETPSLHPDAEGWARHRAILQGHLPFRDFEIARLDEKGVARWRALSGEPVFDASGNFLGYWGVGRDITERKRAEEELRRFRAAMDSSADMIFLVERATMRYIDVNATACKLLGYAREELLTMGPQDILPVGREALERAYDELIANEAGAGASGMRSQYRCKDGSLLPFESTRRVVRSGGGWLIAAISRDTRERMAGELALRRSEERFRGLTALSSDWYWEQDEQLRLTFMSNIEKLGLDPSRYLGLRRWDQPAFNLTEADWVRHRTQLERHEPFRDFQIERRAPDGTSVWLSLSGEPLFDSGGRFAGYRGIGRDITPEKRAADRMRRLGAMYAALGAANEAILRAKSAEELFADACRIAVEAGSFLLGTVFLLDADGEHLARAAASGPVAALTEAVAPSIEASDPGGRGLIGHAWRTGERVVANDYAADPRTGGRQALRRGYEVGSSAVFPLRVEGQLVGVFGLQHRERGAFTEELTTLLQRLADNISFALDGFRRDARRRSAQRELVESEQRFRSLLGLSSDMYWEQDAEYRFIALSDSGPAWLEPHTRSRLLGTRRWEQHYFNMTEADWAAHKGDLDARRPFRDLELGRVTASGAEVWVSVSGEPRFDEAGQFTGYRGIGKDITERKRAAKLRELEHTVARSLAQAGSLADALSGAIRTVCEALGWECGRYFTPHAGERVLRLGAAWAVPSDPVQRFVRASAQLSFGPGVGLTGLVWQSGQAIWVPDLWLDGRATHSALARECGMHGAFIFPVIAEGRTVGVLAFSSRKVREPEDALLQAIGMIGSQIGQLVQRKQAELMLAERQARHLRHQERIARFGQSAIGKREPTELIEEGVQNVLEGLGADAVGYVERGAPGGGLVLRTLVGAREPLQGAIPAAAGMESPLARALASGERVLSSGAALEMEWASALGSAAIVPVRGDSAARGALCVCFRDADGFTPDRLNFIEAVASVLSGALQRIESEGRLAYLAQFDALTGLPNRALFADRFSQMIAQARRRGSILGVLFIDLDEFKMVNDTLGHAAGDELLTQAAKRLQASVRSGDTVARISGDEFAVVLADLARPEDAALVAQKIIDRIGAAFDVSGHEVFVTASVGIAEFPADGDDAETLISAADAAMYRAKQGGRNAYQFFTAEINQRTRARAQTSGELRRALEREEFVLFYQPKVDLATRRPDGAEALLRWRHPERGLVSPLEFIPVLEESGLIVPVGEWVVKRVCEDILAWDAGALSIGTIAVNLSARQFRQPDLDKRILGIVQAAGVPATRLELEITESQLMQDPDHAIRIMRAMAEAGMHVAIDDFGTGYSSLAYLTRFPLDSLKIDRSFVKNALTDSADAAIVRTIVDMAHTLGFSVVAEGVETEAQAALLLSLGCEQAQGFLFARPMSADDFSALVAERLGVVAGTRRRGTKRRKSGSRP